MAGKKRPGASRRKLERALKELGVIEKDLTSVRKNLRKFLDRGAINSGPDSLDRRQKKILRTRRRRR
jgi:hypothetical protein